jgi:hypothetical protein
MGRIEANPDELSGLSGSLKQFSSAGNQARDRLGGVGSAHTGHAGLADALGHFVKQWDYSLKKIGENAAAMADKLGKSGQAYHETEQGIADAASGSAPPQASDAPSA